MNLYLTISNLADSVYIIELRDREGEPELGLETNEHSNGNVNLDFLPILILEDQALAVITKLFGRLYVIDKKMRKVSVESIRL
jgi:hypothetical protein